MHQAGDGERRHLTVLFSDLVNSTEITARLDPEEWRDIASDYQRTTTGTVTHLGGHVAKYLGDGLVVFFGYPQAHEDDTERAVRAGLRIIETMSALNERIAGKKKVKLSVRVGIHAGAVVVGQGGGKESDVFGDAPNIAARVQSAAEPDTVVITAAAQHLVAGLFVVEERGAQHLKGVPEPMVLYRVIQPSGVRSRLEVSAGRLAPFVGRQTELGVLRDAWERVVEGMGQTVLVQGEAGLGKSRLCYELREQLSREPHTWLECRCSPYTSGTAFRPVIELVEQALTFQPQDAPAEKFGKLSVGLGRSGFATGEAVPLLAEWLDLPESAGYTPLAMSPDLKRRKTLETLAAWNLKLGELQPIVVLVEDLHWCDPSSLELFGRLVAQSATARVLLVGTARSEFASPWPGRSNLQTLTLGRLTKRQTREMIASLSAARALPEAVVEQIIARAGGIPLFVEELTHAVVEAGGDAAVAAIPVTLQDSLLARLDRLSAAKDVAQRAAVLGREFSYTLLAATAGLDEGSLQQGLMRLVEAELVFVRGVAPEASYTFKHALVQEAAYESLLKRTRQQLHSRVVDVLVAKFPERATTEPEIVAKHAEAAGRIDDAITYYQRTGENAQKRSAHEEAIRHLRRAIALLAKHPVGGELGSREATLQLSLARSLTPARGFAHAEVEAAYETARVLCETASDARQLGLALSGLASFCSSRGEVERGRAFGARALMVAEGSGDKEVALYAHAQLSLVEYSQGKFASALAHSEAGRSLYEPGRGHQLLRFSYAPNVTTLGYGAWSLWNLGHPDVALDRAQEAVAVARHLGDPFNIAYALFLEFILHWARREIAAQCEQAAEVIAISEAQGFPLFLGIGKAFHAAARVRRGEPSAVVDVLSGLALSAGTGNQGGAPGLFALLGETYLAVGQLTEARGALETGLTVAAQTGQPFWDAELHRLQGEILLADGGTSSDVEALFLRAIEIAHGQDTKMLELRAATSFARLWRSQGKRAPARDLLAPLYAWFTEGFDTADLKDARLLLDELNNPE